uniref:Uncharacterized protein n=1 Tax=Onchocerca volvulus TaxID=6282 RepID=A0A8R1XQY2_ONCVO
MCRRVPPRCSSVDGYEKPERYKLSLRNAQQSDINIPLTNIGKHMNILENIMKHEKHGEQNSDHLYIAAWASLPLASTGKFDCWLHFSFSYITFPQKFLDESQTVVPKALKSRISILSKIKFSFSVDVQKFEQSLFHLMNNDLSSKQIAFAKSVYGWKCDLKSVIRETRHLSQSVIICWDTRCLLAINIVPEDEITFYSENLLNCITRIFIFLVNVHYFYCANQD